MPRRRTRTARRFRPIVFERYETRLVLTSVTPPTGMVSWWPGDGTAVDIADGNDGLLIGGGTYASGMVGQAFSLDGVDDLIEVLDSPSLSGTTALSIEAWIRPTAVGAGEIVTKYNSSIGQVSYFFDLSAGTLLLGVTESPGVVRAVQTDAAVVTANVWSHVAGTFDTATQAIRIYVNGAEVAITLVASSTVATIADTTAPVQIGSIVNAAGQQVNHFAGLIDEQQSTIAP